MLHAPPHSDFLKRRALNEVRRSDIMEWYRQQYNIPLDKFYHQEIDEELVYLDFYRRQYWDEFRYGIRDLSETSTDFKMPVFTLFRPHGGVLPAPNGYGFDNSYTSKIERYGFPAAKSSEPVKQSSSSEPEAIRQLSENEYTISNNPNIPSSRQEAITGGLFKDDEQTYKMNENDFESMLKAMETDDSFWEELERLAPKEE